MSSVRKNLINCILLFRHNHIILSSSKISDDYLRDLLFQDQSVRYFRKGSVEQREQVNMAEKQLYKWLPLFIMKVSEEKRHVLLRCFRRRKGAVICV